MRWRLVVIPVVAVALIAVAWLAERPTRRAAPGGDIIVVHQDKAPSREAHGPIPAGASSIIPPGSTPTPAAAGIPEDPALAATLPSDEVTPATLYRQLRREARDPAWAPRAEDAIRAALATIPNVDGNGAPRVVCAASLCEIHGTIRRDLPMDEANVAMQALQGDPLYRPLDAQQMRFLAGSFGGGSGARTFTLYAARAKR